MASLSGSISRFEDMLGLRSAEPEWDKNESGREDIEVRLDKLLGERRVRYTSR